MRVRGPQEGPPKVPEECFRIAARALQGSPDSVVQRVQKAFESGFCAQVALTNDSFFDKPLCESEEDLLHWIVCYRHIQPFHLPTPYFEEVPERGHHW